MNKFCPLFGHFAQLRSTLPRLKFILPILSSGQEKGRFGVGLGVLCVRTYPRKVLVTAG